MLRIKKQKKHSQNNIAVRSRVACQGNHKNADYKIR